MVVDYDAVNESIMESIMEELGGMNANEFVDSISGMDHAYAGIIMTMSDKNFINRDTATVNDVLDYLEANYNTASEDSPYGAFMGVVTRELDKQSDERSY